MTDYKTIHGKKIKFLTSDLTAGTATEGDLFYSDSDSKFKVAIHSQAWASGGNLNTARYGIGGAGIQTAGLAAGGRTTVLKNESEEYDGSSWTEGNNLNTGRFTVGSDGTQTAALLCGGTIPSGGGLAYTADTELYDGTNWTEVNNLNTARDNTSYAGTTTAGVCAGGNVPGSPTSTANSEEFDGTNWAEGDNLGTSRYTDQGSCGTQTAAVQAGGFTTPPATYLAICEEYDGTSWSEVNNLNTARNFGGTTGIQTACITFAGYETETSTESYDGTTWTTLGATLATGRHGGARFGTQTAAVFGGGNSTGGAAGLNTTEEFTDSYVLKTVTDS